MTKERKEKILKTLNRFRIIPADSPITGCFGWSGSLQSKAASPRILVDTIGAVGAHRAAWMAENGKIPRNQYVHRTCGNRMCTNPTHLFISSERNNPLKTKELSIYRPGRERLSVDLPCNIVRAIHFMASRHGMTTTRYLCKRLAEVLKYEVSRYENQLDKK